MRIVSLLPSATEIVFALGLGDELVGRSHECDYPPEAATIPIVTASLGGHPEETSREIHERVVGAVHGGSSIYRLDEAALAAAKPDLVLTQELCEVCAVSYREVTDAVRAIDGAVTVLSLEPTSIEGIFNTIATVGSMANAEDEAIGLLELLRERLGRIENLVLHRRLQGVPARRVVALEWVDPPFAAGHWVPEQIRRAGGWELLGEEGQRSIETSWSAVAEVDPEQLLLMPCGFDARRAAEEWLRLRRDARPDGMGEPPDSPGGPPDSPGGPPDSPGGPPDSPGGPPDLVGHPSDSPGGAPHSPAGPPYSLGDLRAVRERDVYALDGSSYFSRPGPRVIDGIGMLAEIFDPDGIRDLGPSDGWFRIAD